MISWTSAQKRDLFPLLSWVKMGFFAFLDQGLFACAHFLVKILLARWLDPGQYGAFVMAYSIFLLLASIHSAVLTEPMTIFGAGKYAERFPHYLGILIYGHWIITGLISLTLILLSLIFFLLGSEEMPRVFLGLAIASPFILLLWLLRGAFYVRLQFQWAALGGGLYTGLMLAGIGALYWGQCLSVALALMVMGITSLVVSIYLCVILHPYWRLRQSNPTPETVLTDHWQYGRWSASMVPIIWLPSNIYYTIFPIWLGLEGAAVLGVMTIFVMPLLQTFGAVSNLLFPMLAQAESSNDTAKFRLIVRRVLILLLIASVMFYLLLLMYGEWVLNWLYDGKYQNYTHALFIVGLSSFSFAFIHVLGPALRVVQYLKKIILCYVASVFVTLTLGFWLIFAWGVIGATIGFIISTAVTAISMAVFYSFIRFEKV